MSRNAISSKILPNGYKQFLVINTKSKTKYYKRNGKYTKHNNNNKQQQQEEEKKRIEQKN